jgi:two-component system cell cycle sensor histidine kinase/response regulator CckA
MSQVQNPKSTPDTGQFKCNECQKTDALRQQVRGVVHDFNNILEVIIGYSELLFMNTPDKFQLRNEIAEIKKAADQGTALTRNLLRFYRDEALETDTLDINEFLRESRPFFQRLIGDRFALQIVAGASLYPVRMNASQAQQVVTNLLANARDAMPEGGTLVIESGSLNLNGNHSENQIGVPAGRYTTLTVVDTGGGMDAETRSHIFEPFFTTKKPGKGTGLGLAMVNGILKQNGAYASIESNLGSGTAVKIFLPAAADAKPREVRLARHA